MGSLLSIKIKEQLHKKRNLVMLLIIPLLITYICTYLDNEAKNPSKVYSVAVIDHDKTEYSSSLIANMSEYSEIELSILEDLDKSLRRLARGKYDVVYEIKEGFQDKILSREIDDILISHKEVNSTAVKWLNDQISLIVVRKWLYEDALSRIRNLNPDFSEEEFRQRFDEYAIDNKILSLKVHNINNEKSILEVNRVRDVFPYKVLWASIIIFFVIGFGKKLVDDREKGIIVRLELSGLTRLKYYITSLVLTLLNIIPLFIISYFMMGYFSHKSILNFIIAILSTIIYASCTWLIVLFIGFIFSSKKSYSFASQVYLLISIILGTGLFDGMYKVIDNVSWLFPLKWYINF